MEGSFSIFMQNFYLLYFFINFVSNLNQIQILYSKANSKSNSNPKIDLYQKQIKTARMNNPHFCFTLSNLKFFGKIVNPYRAI